jgi:uncharacterized membrane protein
LDNTLKNGGRLVLLDVMRAWAVFMMIQGHTIDALLSDTYYASDSFVFNIWLFNRGLTAPIFLFGAGFAYVIATSRKMDGARIPMPVIFKRLRWIVVLFVIGALMHLPGGTLSYLTTLSPEQWNRFFTVDVLRLMAVSLLGLFVLFLATRNRERLLFSSIAVAVLLFAIAPFAAQVDWTLHLPNWAAAFMNTKTGSWFPIFPYAGHLFAGAAGAALYLRWKEQGRDQKLPQYFLVGAAAILLVSFVPRLIFGWQLPLNEGASSIWLSFSRVGWVILLWSLIGFGLRHVKRVPDIISVAGQHSLLIYVSHIVVLYGSAWMPGFRQMFGKTMDLDAVMGIIVFLLISTTWAAKTVHQMKAEKSLVYRYTPYAAGIILLTFLVFA